MQVSVECREVQWEVECRNVQRSEGIELVSAGACRDHQEAVGMGMKLPIEVRAGQWACECRTL